MIYILQLIEYETEQDLEADEFTDVRTYQVTDDIYYKFMEAVSSTEGMLH